jgi:hypothetical protein
LGETHSGVEEEEKSEKRSEVFLCGQSNPDKEKIGFDDPAFSTCFIATIESVGYE